MLNPIGSRGAGDARDGRLGLVLRPAGPGAGGVAGGVNGVSRLIPRAGIMIEPAMDEITYAVPDLSCSHCVDAVTRELSAVAGVDRVEVDLATKEVAVHGSALDDERLRAAIEDAGYEAR